LVYRTIQTEGNACSVFKTEMHAI